MPYSFEEQQAPLISMRLYGWLTDADFARLVADLDQLEARGNSFALVLDCSGLRAPEIGHVRQLRSWFCAATPACPRHHRGFACVADTPLLRGTLRAVLQARPVEVPFTIVADPESAREWALARLAQLDRRTA